MNRPTLCRKSLIPLIVILTILTLSTLFASPAMAQQAAISLSSGTTVPGGSVVLNVSLANSGGAQTAAVQWTMGYPLSDVASVSAAAGPGLSAPGKSLSCNTSNGSAICVAYGMNSNIIGNGVLATVTST
jgi:hypothetical protein